MFAHVNALQRDMCPSQTKFEGEVIAMALDLMHAEAVTDGQTGDQPAGLVTTGGTGSILHALIAYREHARETRGVTRPNFVKPETGHAAFDKGCHLFGIELRVAPVDPKTTLADVDAMSELVDDQTIAIMGSAGNYAYGTVDPIAELAALASSRGVGMHVDGCLGGFILPVRAGARLPHPRVRLPRPGCDDHLGRHPQVRLRLQGQLHAAVPRQGAAPRAVLPPARLERRQVHVAGHGGLAFRRADRQHLGVDGLARPRGLPRARARDLRDGGRDDGRRPVPSRAADHGRGDERPADLLLLLHLRRLRDLPPRRLPGPEGLAVQRPAVPQRDPHGRHPATDRGRASSRRSRPTWPRPSPTRRRSRPRARRPSPARSTAAWPAASTRRPPTSSSP